MRIGIDCRMLGQGFGLARYVEQLIKHLQDEDSKNEYVLFLRQKNWNEVVEYDKYEKPQYAQEPVRRQRAIFLQKNFTKVLADIPWYGWAEQFRFIPIIKREKVDVMHFPHWNLPFFYRDPFVVTIHDLTMYHYPRPESTTLGPTKFWLKDLAHRLLLRRVIKRAKRIIATSEFTKNDLVATLKADSRKISVVYQAPFANKEFKIDSQAVKAKYHLTKKYVLAVGAAYPHKNLAGLLTAWQIFTEKYGDEYELVLVGKDDYFYGRLKQSEIFRSQSNIIHTGLVADEELVALYESADLYVFPSLYEGFGLPPLEASAYGLPVVASSSSCLPEVLGEGAVYFDPENSAQMAEVIYLALTDEDVRADLIQKARQNLARFSWQKSAREMAVIYQSVV